MSSNQIEKNDIIKAFNKAVSTYDCAAILQREVGSRLLNRLDWIKINPKRILDLGCGTGFFSNCLKMRYPDADIMSVDIVDNMVKYTKENHASINYALCADAESLPFKNNYFDLVFSNLMLHWCPNSYTVLEEVFRTLVPNGLLLFSTLGPDTLMELRQSWSTVDDLPHVNQFIDMHHIGDALLNLHYKDPVMDSEILTLQYSNEDQLLQDLKNLGTRNITKNRQKSLTGKHKFQKFKDNYRYLRNADGTWPATFEVIYGHALGSSISSNQDLNEFYIPISDIQHK